MQYKVWDFVIFIFIYVEINFFVFIFIYIGIKIYFRGYIIINLFNIYFEIYI